ncbi:MAG: FAA hydrolase family protein, partial [Hydrogenophaga sp.]|nr:FAA hydrolase family protein [Hydrogenophaga sp.]
PEGVGAVRPGDLITGQVQGVADVSLRIGQPE